MASIRSAFPPAVIFAAVGWMSVAEGGFFATSWGWPTLGFLLAAGVAFVARDRVRLGGRDRVLITALAALVCWDALSAVWASGAELPLEASELALLYLAAATVYLLLDSTSLPLGILCAVTPVATYSLATRLVPDHVGTYDPLNNNYLLAGPTGYQNCLGMLCALGILIALGLVAYETRRFCRIAAAVSIVVLLPTLYFTFSRGAAAALLLGILAVAAWDPRRLRFSVTALLALPLPVLGVLLASRSGPLTQAGASLSAAANDGHRLVGALTVLCALQAGVILLLSALDRRVSITYRLGRMYPLALAGATVVLIVAGAARVGNPVSFVSRATDAFSARSPAYSGNLNNRLVTLSGHARSDYWAAAWREVAEHPVLGGGGDTFRRYWLLYRSLPYGVLNVHNLYLETLADLGPVGLFLLLGALAVPLAAARRARRRPMVPVVAGAYVAAMTHAAIDWDWQLPALTLSTLALGATLVVAAREPREDRAVTTRVRVAIIPVTLALVGFVFVAQLGYEQLAAAEDASARGQDRASLADASKARQWLPWAAAPWQVSGTAYLAEDRLRAAHASFSAALRREPSDWSSWLGLSQSSTGSSRARALAQAARLNPLGVVQPKPPDT